MLQENGEFVGLGETFDYELTLLTSKVPFTCSCAGLESVTFDVSIVRFPPPPRYTVLKPDVNTTDRHICFTCNAVHVPSISQVSSVCVLSKVTKTVLFVSLWGIIMHDYY